MKTHGYIIPPDVELAALEFMRKGRFTLGSLRALMIDSLAHTVPHDLPNAAASQLIQRERIEGNVDRASDPESWPPVWKWVGDAA